MCLCHRVVKETIRLTELLLAVLIDGHEAMRSRRALPTVHSGSAPARRGGESAASGSGRSQAQAAAPTRGGSGSARNVPPEFQRRIIDAIRNKDTRTLLDSIENGCALRFAALFAYPLLYSSTVLVYSDSDSD